MAGFLRSEERKNRSSGRLNECSIAVETARVALA